MAVKDKRRGDDDDPEPKKVANEEGDVEEAANKRKEEIARLPKMDVTEEEFRKLVRSAKWEPETIRLLLDFHPKALPKDYMQVGNGAYRIV